MISVTGVTGNYILQPELLAKHHETITWLSTSMLWKSEINAFQKILDERAPFLRAEDQKKKIDHFQNLIIYYRSEIIDNLRRLLREHESQLATMLEFKDESNIQYFKEHDGIMDKLQTFANLFKQFRNELLQFAQQADTRQD